MPRLREPKIVDPNNAEVWRRYYDRQRILRHMDPTERTWLEGFVNGLLYAQANNDKPGGSPTLKTHLPDSWWNPQKASWIMFEDLETKLGAIIKDGDEEGGIVAFRFTTVTESLQYGPITFRQLEVGSSEGHFGFPDWNE